MGKNLKHYSDYLNEGPRPAWDEEEEFAPFTTSDGWDEGQLEDVGLMDLISDIERVAYELRTSRRGSYAKFGDTPQDLGNHLIDLGEALVNMGGSIIADSSTQRHLGAFRHKPKRRR